MRLIQRFLLFLLRVVVEDESVDVVHPPERTRPVVDLDGSPRRRRKGGDSEGRDGLGTAQVPVRTRGDDETLDVAG